MTPLAMRTGASYDRIRQEWFECQYSTVQAGGFSDEFLGQHGLIAKRGVMIDGIFEDTRAGRSIVRNNFKEPKAGKTYAND